MTATPDGTPNLNAPAGPSLQHGSKFVSRGGAKLHHALGTFLFDFAGLFAADLGCSTGGFSDCMLQAGAAHIWCVDTGYGVLAWKLRSDKRVTTIERENALYVAVPPEVVSRGGVDVVVMDLGWTPQRLAVPAACRWLKPAGHIISLVKPHYELEADEKHLLIKGVLPDAQARRVAARTIAGLPTLGVRVLGEVESPVRGSAGKKEGSGNIEVLVLLQWPGDGNG